MKKTLKIGMEFEYNYKIKDDKLVPALFPDADEFLVMPKVFATGFLVGLIELACIKALNPYLDWPTEQSVGISINVDHTAATPSGFEVTVKTKLIGIEGKKLVFEVSAHDGIDTITKGQHERFIINKVKFDLLIEAKKGQGS